MLSILKNLEQYAQLFPAIIYPLCRAFQLYLMCMVPHRQQPLVKKVAVHPIKGDGGKAYQSLSKGKGKNKVKPTAVADPEAAASPSLLPPASKKAKIGFHAWQDHFHGTKKKSHVPPVPSIEH